MLNPLSNMEATLAQGQGSLQLFFAWQSPLLIVRVRFQHLQRDAKALQRLSAMRLAEKCLHKMPRITPGILLSMLYSLFTFSLRLALEKTYNIF